MTREVVVYSRVGCKLCRAAEEIATRVTPGRAALRIVDVDADPIMYERYSVRVPVVTVDGREIAEFEVAEDNLLAALGAFASPEGAASANGARRTGWRSRLLHWRTGRR